MTTVNTQILLKRGNTAVSEAYIGPLGEITMDTGLNTIRVHNGNVAGGSIVGLTSMTYGNANVTAYLPTHAGNVSGTITSAAQPNITSVGTLTALNVAGNITTAQNLVVSPNSANGIFVGNTAISSYGWRDLLHPINVDSGASANKPTFVTYLGGIKQYQFLVNDQAWCEFHMPHDYVVGTDIYIHAHWSHNSTSVTSGGITVGFEITHAKGHNQQAFSTPITTTVQQNASTTQYQHMIAETVMTGAGLIPVGEIEPDSLLLVRMYLSANNMSSATSPFVHFVDVHYQSNGMGTVNKSPNFYTRA